MRSRRRHGLRDGSIEGAASRSVTTAGCITSKVGRRHAGTRVLMLVAGLHVRIVSADGELLRKLELDPSRDYQPMG